MKETPQGGWVHYEDYARLKADVERLQSDLQMEKENEDRLVREWQKANNEVYGLKTQVAALIDDQTRLKAEVERIVAFGTHTIIPNKKLQTQVERLTDEIARLRKAGDNLERVLTTKVASYEVANASHEWHAAKDGKDAR